MFDGAEGYALGAVGGVAEEFASGFVVVLVVAFKEGYLGVAFEGEDVGGNAVEEPAVVGDDHYAAAEVGDTFFEGSESGDVEVVGGFVEEEEVAAGAEELGEVDAVAFTAGEDADFFVLLGAFEVEA